MSAYVPPLSLSRLAFWIKELQRNKNFGLVLHIIYYYASWQSGVL